MKRIIFLLLAILLSVTMQAQIGNAGRWKVKTTATEFGIKLSAGEEIYDVSTGKLWKLTAKTTSTTASLATIVDKEEIGGGGGGADLGNYFMVGDSIMWAKEGDTALFSYRGIPETWYIQGNDTATISISEAGDINLTSGSNVSTTIYINNNEGYFRSYYDVDKQVQFHLGADSLYWEVIDGDSIHNLVLKKDGLFFNGIDVMGQGGGGGGVAIDFPYVAIGTGASVAGSDSLSFTGWKMSIAGKQVMYLPNQSSFLNTIYYGDKGAKLVGGTSSKGKYITAVGFSAAAEITTGGYITALGYSAMGGYFGTAVTSYYNTAVGAFALNNNSTGGYNTAVGANAGKSTSSGGTNTAVGYAALQQNTTANYNTAVGANAMYSNTTAGNNTAVGSYAMYYTTTGTGNTAVGQKAMENNSTGFSNTAIGYQAMGGMTTGYRNVAIGEFAGWQAKLGNANTFIGFQAMFNSYSTSYNVAIGSQCLINSGALTYCAQIIVGVDYEIQYVGTTNWVAIGAASNTLGVKFTATGVGTGTGYAFPYRAESNIGIGTSAGGTVLSTTGANNASPINCIYIGNVSYAGQQTPENEIVIGNAAVGHGSNTVTIGNSSNTYNFFKGVMHLTPQAAPGSPTEGDVYANSSDHHLYFYNGSGWVQLDN